MKHIQLFAVGIFGMFLATGCAGTGERISLNVPVASGAGEKAVAMSAPTVAIQPFDDHRADQSHLGVRHHVWGGESHFSLSKGTLGEATAQAFADYLRGKGWNAVVAKGNGTDGVDILITGKLIDAGVDATSGIGQTTLHAKSRMAVHVQNHADGSQVRETLTSAGDNQVFWFDPEDAQELLNELYSKNFEKFVADTKIDGATLKLRK